MSLALKAEKLFDNILVKNVYGKVFNKEQNLLAVSSMYIAGGALVSLAKGQEVNDIDMFFTNDYCLQKLVLRLNSLSQDCARLRLKVEAIEGSKLKRGYWISVRDGESVEVLMSTINDFLGRSKTLPFKYISPSAMTLRGNIQGIFKYIGEPEDVIQTFDYEHCKAFTRLDPLGFAEVHFDPKATESIARNELHFTKDTPHLLSAISRMVKFTKRGWSIGVKTAFDLATAAAGIDWKSPAVVKEQLVGFYALDYVAIERIMNFIVEDGEVNQTKLHNILGKL